MHMTSLRAVVMVALFAGADFAAAAELAILTPETWAEFVPQGKEVDAIYGDVVLRNDKLVAVVAQATPTRHANMTVKNVGGCVIDLTTRTRQNDQLSAFFPLGKETNWRTLRTAPEIGDEKVAVRADLVSVLVTAVLKEGVLTAETTYTLADGADHLLVETKLVNISAKSLKGTFKDENRTDGTAYIKGTTGKLAWAYERWWNAAYGFVDAGHTTQYPAGVKAQANLDPELRPGEYSVPVEGSVTIARRLLVAEDLRQLQTLAEAVASDARPRTLFVVERDSKPATPVADVYVEVKQGDKLLTAGRTNADGEFLVAVEGDATVIVSSPAHQSVEAKLVSSPRVDKQIIAVERPGVVVASISSEQGAPIPCKVQFRGRGETKDPVFFDRSGEHAVGNLYYSHDGKFRLPIPSGEYDCLISYGPEYDVVERRLTVASGGEANLEAKLIRTLQTPGFISADFHSHSSPSGDNVSSQFGRVLNLLCEHIEYAPCTEHNRLSTYTPHLKRLGVEHLMGTCVGIELTNSPLPTSHFNAFPLKLHEHTQNNGGPVSDADPSVEVARLAMWDDKSEKLIQHNHPDIGWVYFDKNGDGKPDAGFFPKPLPHIDVVEVHPPQNIFKTPLIESKGVVRNNTIFNWLQMLNQGYRLGGVVNTDAHYNIHGSGFLRIYVESPTDDPAKVSTEDIVHAAEHGHIVMTNGPYLEVTARANPGGKRSRGGPGDDLIATGGKVALHVRIQCPNWFDIDRVQLFVNGRPDPKFHFTREARPDAFQGGVVKFEKTLELELKEDAHLIVATIGERSGLGDVMGPEHKNDKPTAVSNPIFIDVAGDGYQPNKDTLGAPLPVRAPGSK